MCEIKYVINGNEINVYINRDIKDAFKYAFKRAKWNPTGACWIINARSLKRLEQWIEEVKKRQVELDELEEAELTEVEIEGITEEINFMIEQKRNNLTKTESSKARLLRLEESKKALDEAKVEFERVKKETDDVAKKEAEAEKKVAEIFHGLIDINAVHSAYYDLEAAGKYRDRKKWDQAQSKVNNQRSKLEAAGFSSRGLDELWFSNFNRSKPNDRDDVTDFKFDDLYILKKNELSEDNLEK